MEKLIIKGGKYEASKNDFVFYPRFWVQFSNDETEMYNGSLEGGGNYYVLKGDFRKQVKQIVRLLGKSSTRALITFFKKNGAEKNG